MIAGVGICMRNTKKIIVLSDDQNLLGIRGEKHPLYFRTSTLQLTDKGFLRGVYEILR